MNLEKRSQPHIDKAKHIVYENVTKVSKFLHENQHVFGGDDQVMCQGIAGNIDRISKMKRRAGI